jgi:hypothetical protein
VGSLEWFSFMLFQRDGNFLPILYGKALLQELVDNMYVCVERCQTNYLRHNQDKLKVKNHKGSLVKSLENENDPSGKKVVLPSSFIGSPCAMSQLYQDAMAIRRVFGAPSLFITMTANPNWPEVRNVIPKGDNAEDHPTEMVRIAYLKIKRLLFELVEMRRLGRVTAYVSTIEFQKRGLPHCCDRFLHISLFYYFPSFSYLTVVHFVLFHHILLHVFSPTQVHIFSPIYSSASFQ